MNWLRNRIRRWLGVPTRTDIRTIVLREIDADTVWREGQATETHSVRRRRRHAERDAAIHFGGREDTRG